MASTGEVWKLGHRPALDGVRGIAILLVLAGHLGVPHLQGTQLVGVTVFFALSGFLITSLLLERRDTLGRFYLRRAGRLLPALLLCVAGYVVLRLAVVGNLDDWEMIVGALTYSTNWLRMTGAFVPNQGGLPHLWSLAVEEQFYLVWPIVLGLLVRFPKRWRVAVAAALVAASFTARAWTFYADGFQRAYNGFDTRADELLIGCVLALLLHGARPARSPRWVAAPLLAGIVALSRTPDAAGVVLMPTAVALLTAALIFVAVTSDPIDWLSRPSLRWFGRRSYAIYLFHAPVVWALEQRLDLPWWLLSVAVLAATLPLAEVSWRLVEAPALAWTAARLDPVERDALKVEVGVVAGVGLHRAGIVEG